MKGETLSRPAKIARRDKGFFPRVSVLVLLLIGILLVSSAGA
jgi:hypothetical protein